MSTDAAETKTRRDFIEKVGMITQAEGLPRIAGRIFGMLVFDGEEVSFGDLATRLDVSRASVSTSVRLLEERGLVKRIAKPGDRQDFFQLASNPYATMVEGVQKRTKQALSEITETIDELPAQSARAQRLRDYAQFYESIESALGVALQNIKADHGKEDMSDDK